MRSGTAGRRLCSRFLSSLRPMSDSNSRFPFISRASTADIAVPAFIQSSHLHSEAGSSQSGHMYPPPLTGGVSSVASCSTASTTEAATVLGSLGAPASFSIAQRVRDASEIMRHYGRCYWELSKARLRFLR